jgi:hypothetical protein
MKHETFKFTLNFKNRCIFQMFYFAFVMEISYKLWHGENRCFQSCFLCFDVVVLQTWCVFVLLACSIKASEGSILL